MNDITTTHDNSGETDQRAAALRNEIDDSRDRLGQTADAIGDKVLPGRIIERQKQSAASGMRGVRDRFMGSAESAGHGISDTANSTVEQVKHAPDALAQRTEGSPLIVGAVAFGIGLLAAAVFKPTERERQAVTKLTDAAPDLRSKVEEAGQDLASSVKEHASEAVEEVKSSVSESASTVKDAATDNCTSASNIRRRRRHRGHPRHDDQRGEEPTHEQHRPEDPDPRPQPSIGDPARRLETPADRGLS